MKPENHVEQQLEELADAIGHRDSFVNDVIRRIQDSPVQRGRSSTTRVVLRSTLMKTPFKIAAAAMIAIAAFLSLTLWDNTVPIATAGELLASAIHAVENTCAIHIKAQLRTLPGDNFASIELEHDFVPIELWAKKCQDGRVRMRCDKPRRQYTVDGQMATMIIGNQVVVQAETSYYECFDSGWLLRLLKVEDLLESELELAKNDGAHEITVYHEIIDGQDYLVLKRYSQANVSREDYCRNSFIENAERTYYYYFDPETRLLMGMQLLVHTDEQDVLVFEITDIQYNPQIDDALFTLEIPHNAIYSTEPQILPDNERYENMNPLQAAHAFFTACAQHDWDEFLKYWPMDRADYGIKLYLGGLEIVSLGKPFQSEAYGGWFVPYEIKLRFGGLKKHNLALRNDNPAKRWVVDGGI